ncbi:coiled-coil domain-containing protein 186 isoform X1 [Musca domestica]|uniref:Coiled-coil domain-containing protein 186 isoform X1 n=1 Tax=Musca domestica TaxID=7370 RepID=A0A9J7IE83_MUSDO|nr:coiled-coil domain-containing protein 186 isoform X1 [Musca domestica]
MGNKLERTSQMDAQIQRCPNEVQAYIEDLEDKLRQYKGSDDNPEKQSIKELKAQISELQSIIKEYKSLENQNSDLAIKYSSAIAELEKCRKSNAIIDGKFAQIAHRMNDELQMKYESAMQALNDQKRKMNRAFFDLGIVRAECQELRQENYNLKLRNQSVTSQQKGLNDELQTKYKSAMLTIEERNGEINHMISNLAQLKAECQELRQANENLKLQIEANKQNPFENGNQTATSKQIAFEEHYKALDNKYVDMQEKLFEMQLQNHELRTQLEEANKNLNRSQQVTAEQQTATNTPDATTAPVDVGTSSATPETMHSLSSSDTRTGDNNVLIKGFDSSLDNNEIKCMILTMADLMDLQIKNSDITNISRKESKSSRKSNRALIVVELKQIKIKNNMLKNKEKLKNFDSFKDIEIWDYISDDVHQLFQYAKDLKNHGFQAVYLKNNSVYAIKNRTTNSRPILIKTSNQVDELKNGS